MSQQPRSTEYPSLFTRVFLSHLILLFTMFVSVIVLFMYLFEPGIKYFLMHPPLIVFPIVLGLVGIAGILSAWTAAAIAEPLEHIEESLKAGDPALEIHMFDDNRGTEETSRVVNSIRIYQDQVLSKESKQSVAQNRSKLTQTLVLTVSLRGIILSANLAAEIFTGISRRDLRYNEFERLISPEANAEQRESLGNAIREGTPFSELSIHFKDMNGLARLLKLSSTAVFDTAGRRTGLLLFGKDVAGKAK